MQSFVPRTSITFVSQASIDTGTVASYELRKRVEAVRNCRKIGKKDMKYNDVMPKMKVDPESYVSKTVAPSVPFISSHSFAAFSRMWVEKLLR